MRVRAGLLLLATVAALSLGAPPVARPAEDLTVVSDDALTARLREVIVNSPAVGAETPLRVLLPADYDANAPEPYPVLYLLHGAGDDYTSWTRRIDLESITPDLRVVIVMPNAGRYGWYSNWYNNGAGGPPRWEDHHIRELIPWVERTYRVRTDRQGRAVAGISMGGFGAMSYAARHPDLFAAAASFSGAVDSNTFDPAGPIASDLRTVYEEQKPPASIWGDRTTQEVRWRGHNPWDLAENLSGVRVTLRTGNGQPGGEFNSRPDPVELYVHQQSVNLHDRLIALGKSHVWEDYGAGSHEWTYWQRDFLRTLPDFLDEFTRPALKDPAFTYKSIEPDYSVYGWRVQLERPVVEFSTFAAKPDGFSLTGTGKAVVTTAARYTPGATYDIAGATPAEAVADSEGRLRLEVDLGPVHPFQQYTPPADAQELVAGAAYFKTVEVTIRPTPPPSGRDSSAPAAVETRGERGGRLPATGATSLAGLGVLAAALGVTRVRERARPIGGTRAPGRPTAGRWRTRRGDSCGTGRTEYGRRTRRPPGPAR